MSKIYILNIDIFTLFSRASEARARLYNSMILNLEQIYRINNYVDQYDFVAYIASIKACLIVINEENFQKIALCNKQISIIHCNILCNSKNCPKLGGRGESSKYGLNKPN